MTTRSTQLVLKKLTVAGTATLYTSPPGTVTIVKWLSAYNASGAAVVAQWLAASGTSGDLAVLSYANALGNAGLLSEAVWQVLEPGDHLAFFSNGQPINVMASGAVLPTA